VMGLRSKDTDRAHLKSPLRQGIELMFDRTYV
jgi:hypothetical protein